MSNNFSIVACVFFAMATSLLSCCIATRGYTYRYTDIWEGFMKYAVEMGSGTMTYIPSFIEICPGVQKLIWKIHRHTDSMVI
jgi:hypothetical protein